MRLQRRHYHDVESGLMTLAANWELIMFSLLASLTNAIETVKRCKKVFGVFLASRKA